MRVVIGPVSGHSAKAWLGYARDVLDELSLMAPGECVATPEVLDVFAGYVTVWETAADDGEFLWSGEIAPDLAEYHMHAFQKVASILTERSLRTGVVHAPPEGEAFYLALIRGVLTALEGEGSSHAEFAQHLGEFWPGRELD